MSDLIAIAYPDKETASQVMRTVARLQTEHLIEVEDAVAVIKDEAGKVRLDQAVDLMPTGAVAGGLWGTLIGALFFAPLLGMALGAASGALGGKLSDYGIEDQFARDLGAQLQPGTSALFVLVRKVTPDKVLDELRQYGGTVLRTSLTRDAEERLQAALSRSPPRRPAPAGGGCRPGRAGELLAGIGAASSPRCRPRGWPRPAATATTSARISGRALDRDRRRRTSFPCAASPSSCRLKRQVS